MHPEERNLLFRGAAADGVYPVTNHQREGGYNLCTAKTKTMLYFADQNNTTRGSILTSDQQTRSRYPLLLCVIIAAATKLLLWRHDLSPPFAR